MFTDDPTFAPVGHVYPSMSKPWAPGEKEEDAVASALATLGAEFMVEVSRATKEVSVYWWKEATKVLVQLVGLGRRPSRCSEVDGASSQTWEGMQTDLHLVPFLLTPS